MQLLVMTVECEWQWDNSIRSAIFQQYNAQGYWLNQTTVAKLQSKHLSKASLQQDIDFNSNYKKAAERKTFAEYQFFSVVYSCGLFFAEFPRCYADDMCQAGHDANCCKNMDEAAMWTIRCTS